MSALSSLSGVKRTYAEVDTIDANDPYADVRRAFVALHAQSLGKQGSFGAVIFARRR